MASGSVPSQDLLGRVRRARVPPGTLALWYTGGAGYVVKTAQTTFLIDPFVGPSNPPHWLRAIPPAFDPETATDVAAVVLTHEHGDHADPAALGPIGRRTAATVIGPESCIEVARGADWPAERARVVNHDEVVTIADVRLTAVAVHDPGAQGCNGYVLQVGDIVVLHCGDSVYFPGFVELGRRWAITAICISVAHNPPGRSIYMDEADAARAARDAKARILIPHHYDLWQGFTLDPRRVAQAARWYCPETRVRPARFGQRLTLPGL